MSSQSVAAHAAHSRQAAASPWPTFWIASIAVFLLSMLVDAANRWWRVLSLMTVAALTVAVLIVLLVSEAPRLSLLSSLPFAAATAFFAGRLQAG